MCKTSENPCSTALGNYLGRRLPLLVTLVGLINGISLFLVVLITLNPGPGNYHLWPLLLSCLLLLSGILLAAELLWLVRQRVQRRCDARNTQRLRNPPPPPEPLPIPGILEVRSPTLQEALQSLILACVEEEKNGMRVDIRDHKVFEAYKARAAMSSTLLKVTMEVRAALRRAEEIGTTVNGAGIRQLESASKALVKIRLAAEDSTKTLKPVKTRACKS